MRMVFILGKMIYFLIQWAKQFSKFPIVAIGGIKTSNVERVSQVHPDFICAVSELNESQDMQNTVYELMSGYRFAFPTNMKTRNNKIVKFII